MDNDLPAPLVAAEIDLRPIDYMPLFGHRLFGSDFDAAANDTEFRAGVRLWWAAFQSKPAGSLPNNPTALCQAAGFGRDLKAWARIEQRALHGFVLCSDGRLYHPALVEPVTAAWRERKASRERKRRQRENQARREWEEPEQAGNSVGDAVSRSCPVGQDADVTVLRNRERYRDSESISSLRSESESPSARAEPHQVTLALPLPGGARSEPRRARKTYDAEFDAWWQHYPHKVAKDAAARAYEAAIKRGATPADLAAGLARAQWPADPNYIPHPATWLNSGRWKDQPAPRLPNGAREYGFTDPEGRRRAIYGALAGELKSERRTYGAGGSDEIREAVIAAVPGLAGRVSERRTYGANIIDGDCDEASDD